MKWPHRKPREVIVNIGGTDPVNGLAFPVNVVHSRLEVHHVIERKPYPMPTRVWCVYRNRNGELYQGSPVAIFGRQVMMYPVPLSWITGRHEDIAIQMEMELRFEYEK